jgi:hypothetical protein
MFQKKYKTELTCEHTEGLKQIIEFVLAHSDKLDIGLVDKFHLAAMSEVLLVLKRKTLEHKRRYKITLTPTQALSLSILYRDYIANQTTVGFMQNKLLQMTNEINQIFSIR